jgi:hypothetical protein
MDEKIFNLFSMDKNLQLSHVCKKKEEQTNMYHEQYKDDY